MTNLKKSNFQVHFSHLVSPSRWPLNTSLFPLYYVKCLARIPTAFSGANIRYFNVSSKSLATVSDSSNGFVISNFRFVLTPLSLYEYNYSMFIIPSDSEFFSTMSIYGFVPHAKYRVTLSIKYIGDFTRTTVSGHLKLNFDGYNSYQLFMCDLEAMICSSTAMPLINVVDLADEIALEFDPENS